MISERRILAKQYTRRELVHGLLKAPLVAQGLIYTARTGTLLAQASPIGEAAALAGAIVGKQAIDVTRDVSSLRRFKDNVPHIPDLLQNQPPVVISTLDYGVIINTGDSLVNGIVDGIAHPASEALITSIHANRPGSTWEQEIFARDGVTSEAVIKQLEDPALQSLLFGPDKKKNILLVDSMGGNNFRRTLNDANKLKLLEYAMKNSPHNEYALYDKNVRNWYKIAGELTDEFFSVCDELSGQVKKYLLRVNDFVMKQGADIKGVFLYTLPNEGNAQYITIPVSSPEHGDETGTTWQQQEKHEMKIPLEGNSTASEIARDMSAHVSAVTIHAVDDVRNHLNYTPYVVDLYSILNDRCTDFWGFHPSPDGKTKITQEIAQGVVYNGKRLSEILGKKVS